MDEAMCFNLAIFYAIVALCIIGFAIGVWEEISNALHQKKHHEHNNLNLLNYGVDRIRSCNKPIDFKVGPDERDECWDLSDISGSRPITGTTVIDRKRSRVYWSDGFGNTFIVR